MDAKRRPPPIPEKTVAGMPAAKPPVPGSLPTPPIQVESQAGRSEVEVEAKNPFPSNAEGGEHHQGDNSASERFDPPVGGQFTSPAVAIMDPMKKQARRKNNMPSGYINQQQPTMIPGAAPSPIPALSSVFVGKGSSAISPNGVQGVSDIAQPIHPAATQQQHQKHLRSPSVKRAPGATVTMQGWLHKQGSDGLMLWKRRWFVLSEFCLFYYKGREEEKLLGSILLPSYIISPCGPDEPKRGGQRKHSFKAEHHNMRTYYFAADSSELMERWMHYMNLASLLQRDFKSGPSLEGASWDERQSGRPSVSSFSSLLNPSADDSDSGFHGGRSPKHATMAVGSSNPTQSATVPLWATKGKKLEEETVSEVSRERDSVTNYRKGTENTPEVPSLPSEFQPLYANAPPKPRRLNSGGRDYSTSPERSPERKSENENVAMRSRRPNNEPQQNGVCIDRGQRISRPTVSYASIRHERNSMYQQQITQMQQTIGIPIANQAGFPIVDRRTPDTYGRSNTGENSNTGVSKIVPNRVEYEDVYTVNQSNDQMIGRMNRWSCGPHDTQNVYPPENNQNAVQQQPSHIHHCPPSGPSSQQGFQQQHIHGMHLGMVQKMPISHPYSVCPTTAQHQHPPLIQQHSNQQFMPPQPQPQVLLRRTPPLPRPHSADFLGHYDHNQMTYVMPLPTNIGRGTTPSLEQPSPKIPSGPVDGVQKHYPSVQTVEMREKQTVDIISGEQIQRPKSSMEIRPLPQNRSFDPVDYWSEESYARMMRQSLYMHAHHVHPSSSSSHRGSETSSGIGNHQLQNWSNLTQETSNVHQSSSRPLQTMQKQHPNDTVELRNKTVEDFTDNSSQRLSTPPNKRDVNPGVHFLRSASARMPRSRYHSGDNLKDQSSALSAVPGEEIGNGERKMQQREESMRRLLEWKQRMLQSPLTRKSSSSSQRKSVQESIAYNPQMDHSQYKQMVLKQLANQEAAATATNSWEHASRRSSGRRGPDEMRHARSRSHDGRRSSTSLSRYNSYSSDDEASGSGSIREPAPSRHPKNDPSSNMLIVSQPTSIPIQSPTYVQPPTARLVVPHLKQHNVTPQGAEADIDTDGKGKQWRGKEGNVVSQAVPTVRWEREDVEPHRRPAENLMAPEREFHCMQRNVSSPKHDVTNGGGGRGRKGREKGEAEKAGERRKGDGGKGEVSVSAGDLLGRTHEELVLLLIQLRRQSAAVSNAIDLCQADLRAQARLAELEMHRRAEHLKKLEELKKHLLELEKQYEKGKPLINLVDNMVKLGSLYRGNTDAQGRIRGWRGVGGELTAGPSPAKDRLQFNQRVQEQRLLAEERRDWSRLSPDHGELQAKVQQLYRLDRLLQEESVTIQSLQQDKELLEKALGGLRHKLQGSTVPNAGNLSGSTSRDLNSTKGMWGNTSMVDPAEAEHYRKQQKMLEKELSRVRQLLAHNSKKLEETVAENARLEQELVVLRQKLQLSRRTLDHPTSPSSASAVGNSASPSGATASLEAELRRVQSAVGDLQRQRHELSVQVRQLTEKSHSLVEQIRPGPTGVAGAGPIPAKKRHHSTWMVTDLDSMESIDCGVESPGPGPSPSRGAPLLQPLVHSPQESAPLYVNTTLGQHAERDDTGRRATTEETQMIPNGYELAEGETGEEAHGYQAMDINEADDRMKRFYGIIPREKPEIKTVRIVKRESERRHRDRTSKRVVLVEDSGENPCAATASSLNRVLEEEAVEGDEEEEAMAYHAHQQQSQQLHNLPSVPFSPGYLSAPEDDPNLSQFFQRSMSLPRVLGKQRGQPPPVPPPPPLRVASPRGSSAAVRRQQLRLRSEVNERPRSAHEQLFGTTQDDLPCLPQPSLSYSVLPSYSPSPSSHSASPTLYSPSERAYPPIPPTPDSPPPIAYKSEAAREIALEMAALHSGENWTDVGQGSVKKRATPKEKRRHYTVSCSRPLELESIVLPKMGSARSRDDLDMEQVLRPRLNAPDVVRSTMSHRDFKYNEHTIDSVLGTPNKIVIPERYIPEQAPELSEEEQMQRLKKAEAIRKMLSETTPISAPEVEENQQKKTSIIKKKVAEEKRQREHILQLNQILAKQVMEKSKMVAGTTPVAAFGTQD